MAEVGGGARAAGWLLLGIAAVALDGCFERHEPANPFIGPYGSAEEGSFGALPGAAGSADQARMVRPAPVPAAADLLLVQVPWRDDRALDLPRWARGDARPASPGATSSN